MRLKYSRSINDTEVQIIKSYESQSFVVQNHSQCLASLRSKEGFIHEKYSSKANNSILPCCSPINISSKDKKSQSLQKERAAGFFQQQLLSPLISMYRYELLQAEESRNSNRLCDSVALAAGLIRRNGLPGQPHF